jgi:hypothetical protein
MDDLKVELEELKRESDSGTVAGTPPAVRSARRSWVWAAAAIAVVAIAVTVWLFSRDCQKIGSRTGSGPSHQLCRF